MQGISSQEQFEVPVATECYQCIDNAQAAREQTHRQSQASFAPTWRVSSQRCLTFYSAM